MTAPHAKFSAGLHIHDAAVQLVSLADRMGEECRGTFNGVELSAAPGARAEDVRASYDRECNRRSDEYRASPEGQTAARQRDDRRQALQDKHDSLVARLPTLPWSDDAALLQWLCDIQEATDHVDVIDKRDAIVAAFEAHGFTANANTRGAYREADRDNAFRYLVGQALDGLKNGPAIHPILHKFAAEWRERFVGDRSSPVTGGLGE